MTKASTLHTNLLWDELRPGMTAEIRRLCHADDFYVFAHASGNLNPMHLPREDGDGDGAPEAVAPAMWLAALVSGVLGNLLPGPGTLYRSQEMRFIDRAVAGETVVASVTLTEKCEGHVARFSTRVDTEDGRALAEGRAEVIVPRNRVTVDARMVPGLTVQSHAHFERLLAEAEPFPALPTAIVAPEEASALSGVLLAAKHTLIQPILVGDPARIRAVAAQIGADLTGYEIVPAAHPIEAAARAVALIHEGRAKALMKGHIHSEDFLRHIVKSDGGLRTHRRISHVFVMDVPGLDHLLFLTDAAINIAPDLACKVDIVQNAIDLARALGLETPRVAILSAVETVTAKIPSTLDAAALSKMAERGQITGGLVDGPLAMDNAIDLEAARTKGIHSAVAGQAQILVVPNLESGNMLAKELSFVAHAEAAGIVVGARCPIILTSRADSAQARLASCALAVLAHHRRPAQG
jgi:phosphotransacetylase/acyl dehydratase